MSKNNPEAWNTDDVPATERTPFGIRLEQELIRHGLTQAELATSLGVSQQTVSKWIIGETAPRRRHVPVLEEMFGVERGEFATLFFAQLGALPPPEARKPPRTSVAALAKKLSRLSADELLRVESYIDGLFDNRQ